MQYALDVPKKATINMRVDESLKEEIAAAAASELQDITGFFMKLYADYRNEKQRRSAPSPLTKGKPEEDL